MADDCRTVIDDVLRKEKEYWVDPAVWLDVDNRNLVPGDIRRILETGLCQENADGTYFVRGEATNGSMQSLVITIDRGDLTVYSLG